MPAGQQTTGGVQGGAANLTNAGKGRKKGVPNRMTKQVKEMILAALDKAGGVDYLTRQDDESPNAFLYLFGKVLPIQVTGEGNGPLQISMTALEEDRRSGWEGTGESSRLEPGGGGV